MIKHHDISCSVWVHCLRSIQFISRVFFLTVGSSLAHHISLFSLTFSVTFYLKPKQTTCGESHAFVFVNCACECDLRSQCGFVNVFHCNSRWCIDTRHDDMEASARVCVCVVENGRESDRVKERDGYDQMLVLIIIIINYHSKYGVLNIVGCVSARANT